MRKVPRIRLMALAAGLYFLLPHPAVCLERLEPTNGCYLGFNVGERDSLQRLSSRLGLTPAVSVQFYPFPFTSEGWTNLTYLFTDVREIGGIALVTLEPFEGLTNVTTNACIELANFCASFETQGIGGIILRFAHEMNGNWYPWGQQPILYKEKFRLLAEAIHARTVRTALLWAPNNGEGYPYSPDGPYQPPPGTPDFLALDTDGNGVLTTADDMYEPYYPGNDVVDWVGMTIYHWGTSYPWMENEMPQTNSFARTLTGTGSVPNFYSRYCADGVRDKPMAIPETSAFYNTQQPGANEFAIKQAWWQQVFNISGDNSNGLDVAVHFPKLKCVNWFDHYKRESEAENQWVDWRVSATPLIREAFLDYVRLPHNGRPYFLTAPEVQRELTPYGIVPVTLPSLIPLSGTLAVTLETKVPANCDLVIDLLDETYQWRGGTRVPVAAGTRTYNANLALTQTLTDGDFYRWSIFLAPPGSNYLSALAWYRGPRPVARALAADIQIAAAPPVWLTGSNLAARLQYTTTTNSVLHLNLLDGALNWRTGKTVSVTRRDGVLDLTLPGRTGIANGDYWLEALVSNSPTNRTTPYARSVRVLITLASTVSSNTIAVEPKPSNLLTGEVLRFVVAYSSFSNHEVRLELLSASSNLLASMVQPVGPGAGVKDLTITHVGVTAGVYRVRAFLAESSQTNAPLLATAPLRTLDVFGSDYAAWVESHWGVVLETDLTGPSEDSDGDGGSNMQEYGALTNPRDANQVLQARVRVSGNQIIVSWPSVVGRNYRVQYRTNAASGVWNNLATLVGNGSTLQVSTGATSGPRFFRVQAYKP